MSFRIHDLQVETRERGSATDNLRGPSDFRDLSGHASLSEREGTLVDGNDVATTERDRQSILGQPEGNGEALGLEPIGLKHFQKPGVGIRLYRFRRAHQYAKRTQITSLEAFLRKPPGAQAIVVGEVGGSRRSGVVRRDRIEPQDRALNEVHGSEPIRRATLQCWIEVAPDQSHIVILRYPGN